MTDNNPSDKGDAGDKELDELLDSALSCFDKKPEIVKGEVKPEEIAQGEDDIWGVEYLREVQKKLKENMKELFGQEDNEGCSLPPEAFNAHLQKMAEEANKVLNEHAMNPKFSETIAQTSRNLLEHTENLDTELGPSDLSAMMEGLGLGGPDLSNEMLPLIQSVMKSFLSKEVLYAPIKEITDKYPTWLEEHKNNLDVKDYESYEQQFHLMEEVCKEFEEENDNDSLEDKNKRFTKVLGLMEEMQKLGQPPKDLVGEGGPFGLDDSLANQLPGLDQSQCSIM